jgi:hypothetical protein
MQSQVSAPLPDYMRRAGDRAAALTGTPGAQPRVRATLADTAARSIRLSTRCVVYLWEPTPRMEAARLACQAHAGRFGWTLVGFHADHSAKDTPDLAEYALDDCRMSATDLVITTRGSVARMGGQAAAWVEAVEHAGCFVDVVDVPAEAPRGYR